MAIAYDNKTMQGWSSAGSTSYTASHVVGSGTERFLVVSVTTANWTAGKPTNVTVTYAGVSMTEINKNIQVYNTNNWRTHCFWMVNPTSGTNNVIVTTTGGSGVIRFVAVSYTGVDQTSPILTSNTASSPVTGNVMSISLTTSLSAWWAIAGGHVDNGWTGGANTTTVRESTAASGYADSNGDISAQTGNAQMSHSFNRGYGGIAFAFKPSPDQVKRLTMMGIG